MGMESMVDEVGSARDAFEPSGERGAQATGR